MGTEASYRGLGPHRRQVEAVLSRELSGSLPCCRWHRCSNCS